jgi:hypothetical protein
MAPRQCLSGTWVLQHTSGAEEFLVAAGVGWAKRKVAVKLLNSSKSTQVYEQHGSVFSSRVQRMGKWSDEPFTVDGEKQFTGAEENGVGAWRESVWDNEGWLLQTASSHEGSTAVRIGLLDANTLVKQVAVLNGGVPSEAKMVRTYTRDGEPLRGGIPLVVADNTQCGEQHATEDEGGTGERASEVPLGDESVPALAQEQVHVAEERSWEAAAAASTAPQHLPKSAQLALLHDREWTYRCLGVR